MASSVTYRTTMREVLAPATGVKRATPHTSEEGSVTSAEDVGCGASAHRGTVVAARTLSEALYLERIKRVAYVSTADDEKPLGYVEGIRYIIPYAEGPAYLDREATKELTRFSLPHIEVDRRCQAGYRRLLGESGDLDTAVDALKYWKGYLNDYDRMMEDAVAIPAFLHLGRIEEMGGNFGVFAREDIAANTFLGCFSGKLVPREAIKNFDYVFNIEEFCVDATKEGNYFRYVNHSAEHPNVNMKLLSYTNAEGVKQLVLAFYSICPIAKGEQLQYPYGPMYDWSHVPGGRPIESTPRTFMLDVDTGKIAGTAARVRKAPAILDL